KHLKDLETKVQDLEKASESANHENSILRAQVEKLHAELREYKRRLSLNGGLNRSSSLNAGLPPYLARGLKNAGDNFQFDFPKFGSLPGSHIFNSGSLAKTDVSRKSSSPPTSSNIIPN